MRLLRLCMGLLCVLAMTPAYAPKVLAQGVGRPEPVESPAEEEAAPTAPARKPAATPARPVKPAAPAATPSPTTAPTATAPKPTTTAAPATAATAPAATDQPVETILNEPARAAELGWRIVDDAATGAKLGLPMTMLPKKQDTRDGTLWSSRLGDMQVETFRIANGLALAAVFEMEKQRPRRKVENSAIKADNFIISGLQGLRKFSVRAQAKDGEVRGVTLQYDQAIEGIVEPIANAMAITFTPYPVNGVAPPTPPSRKVEYGSGVVMSAAGHIVTDKRLTDNCQTLVVGGYGPAETIASDGSFTLLRIYGARGLKPAALAAAPAAGDVTLRGVPEPQAQDGKSDMKEFAAKASAETVSAPGGGYSGAGAFDRDGKLTGLVSLRSGVYASTQLTAPQATLLPLAALRVFLTQQNVPSADTASGPATVLRLICVRG